MGSMLRPLPPFTVKKICIIGSGPSGLAAAKYLLAEKAFEKIDIIEQQSEVGGVWNYTDIAEKVPAPQTSPNVPLDKPVWMEEDGTPVFSNPMYKSLLANLPKQLMAFSDVKFDAESLLFPSREDIKDYLIRYAADIRSLITFYTQVQDVRCSTGGSRERWDVTLSSLLNGQKETRDYDAVVVASGHYSAAFLPRVPGIEDFDAAYPAVISHAKTFRSPSAFENKKVIVVGSGPSGRDIGTQVSTVCKLPLLNSLRTSPTFKVDYERKREVPPISEYIVTDRSVKFTDGTVEKDIDAVIYCTGYLYSYPFLRSPELAVITDGLRARGLYQQLFHIDYPTIVFPALAQRIVPFPFAEVQGALVAKIWANKLGLPSKGEMRQWEQSKVAELGDNTAYHLLPHPKDGKYINKLHDWVEESADSFAKKPPYWAAEQFWMRGNLEMIRTKFNEDGSKARSMEELGLRIPSSEL